jgi:LemA protein
LQNSASGSNLQLLSGDKRGSREFAASWGSRFIRVVRGHEVCLAVTGGGMNIIVDVGVLLAIAGFFIYTVILYNELIRLRNDSDRAWANIDVLLKQRHDEIPNLVEAVKRYMQHERQTLEAVTQARTTSLGATTMAEKAHADFLVTNSLHGLFAVAENYPQLKAGDNFLRLQNRISELEEKIADRREFFNDDVNTYNTRIRQLPEVFLASFMNLQPRELFKVSDADRQQVEVKLG